jgi:hypothetical protein
MTSRLPAFDTSCLTRKVPLPTIARVAHGETKYQRRAVPFLRRGSGHDLVCPRPPDPHWWYVARHAHCVADECDAQQVVSTVLTSNKGFEEWGEVFGDETMPPPR